MLRQSLAALRVIFKRNPALDKTGKVATDLIPDKYKAVCLISADLEGAWAFRHSKSSAQDKLRPVKLGLQTRRNLPQILALCEKYRIPITWATVGHLFLSECIADERGKHPELPHPAYFTNEFWSFRQGDWYDTDPCTNQETDPAWYGADIMDAIQNTAVQHEIGCHTFSHIDCSDERCPRELFMAELEQCRILAEDRGIKLKSFVHPGHQIGHITDLAELGYESYRTDDGNWISLPAKRADRLWELRNTAEITIRKGWSLWFHRFYYKQIIKRAIKHKKVAVLWFHPSCPEAVVSSIMQPLFETLHKNRDNIWTTTHQEYTAYLNSRI